MLSDSKNYIIIKAPSGDIVLDHRIKTCDDWLAKVEFHQETRPERAQLEKSTNSPC